MSLRDFHPAVLATALATFTAFLGIGIVDPILPSIASEMGASHFMVELLFTSYLLVLGLANLVAGALATRIGSKRTMLLGLAIVAVFAGACALVSTIEFLAVLRGFWGLGNALFTTTALAIIVGVATGNSETAITLYEAALGFGIACGPLVGGLLGAQSWRLPFAGTSVLMVVAFGFVVLTVSESETERKQGVRDIVGTFRHTGVLTNAIIGLLYTFGFSGTKENTDEYAHHWAAVQSVGNTVPIVPDAAGQRKWKGVIVPPSRTTDATPASTTE